METGVKRYVYFITYCYTELGGSTSLVSDISLMMDGEEVTTIDSYNSNADGAFNINEQACAVVILPCETGNYIILSLYSFALVTPDWGI